MDLETAIAIVWIGWVGSSGIIITLLLSSEKYREWSIKKTGAVGFSLAAIVVVTILALVLMGEGIFG